MDKTSIFLLFCFIGNSRKLDDSEVSISGCKKGRCRLRKKSTVTIELKLKPGKYMTSFMHINTGLYELFTYRL